MKYYIHLDKAALTGQAVAELEPGSGPVSAANRLQAGATSQELLH